MILIFPQNRRVLVVSRNEDSQKVQDLEHVSLLEEILWLKPTPLPSAEDTIDKIDVRVNPSVIHMEANAIAHEAGIVIDLAPVDIQLP